jgi:phenylpropionate dioxygenase-like ring-hydroxylating dioxygenase large terminal subunit
MDLATQREITKRLFAHHHNDTTEYAPHWVEYPADRYISEEQFRREREYVFGRAPLMVAFSGDVPEPRSWRALDWTPTPILLVRGDDGAVRAFANVCRHRGMRVASGCGTGARRFSCPFHSWTYDTDGALVGMPMADGFVDLPRAEHGLVPLPVAERYGTILVSCRPGGVIDAEAHFAGLGPELESWGFADYRLLTEHDVHPMQGNWKVCWDTFNETYHVPYLHPTSLAQFVLGNCLTVDTFGPHARMATPIKSLVELEDQPEDQWEPIKHISFQYRMLPTAALTIAYDHISFYQVYPGPRPDTCIAIRGVYVRSDISEDEAIQTRERTQWIWKNVIIPEDFSVVELATRGLASGAVPTMVYGANEPAMMHLHEHLERLIAEGIAQG